MAAECMFTWYWLADVCAAEGVAFVRGHALAMKAIHGGKAKNDRIDSHKIAVLLRGGMLPHAYVDPAAMRSTRDLFLRHTTDGKKILARLEKRHGKGKALSILAHKIGRAVYDMLSRGTGFSMEKFRAA